ncbi:MAG: phosphoethanolamine transferase, partial [Arcobacter sp.]
MKNLTQYKLIYFVAAFITAFLNISFFKSILNTYPISGLESINILSIVFVLFALIVFLFSLVASKYT